jgi:hypothetical protein
LATESNLTIDLDMARRLESPAPGGIDCLGLLRVEVATWSGKENATAVVHSVLMPACFHLDPN